VRFKPVNFAIWVLIWSSFLPVSPRKVPRACPIHYRQAPQYIQVIAQISALQLLTGVVSKFGDDGDEDER
jgi:hypothetical protein